MTTCPNCGKEVREDFSFCPYCETPLKPFCPSCKRELQADYARCPYCGFKLGPATPANRLYQRKGGKSIFLRVVTLLSFAGGVIDTLLGTSVGTYNYDIFLYPPAPQIARYLALAQVAFGVILIVFGIFLLVIVYGLIYEKRFSRKHILNVASLTFILSMVVFLVDVGISSIFPLAPIVISSDIFFVLWSLFVLVVIWRYVRQQDLKDFLYSPTIP